MVRVNLLPPEVLDKRKAERHWVYVVFGGVVVAAVLLVAFMIPAVILMNKQAELEMVKQERDELQVQAERFKIFEDKESVLRARQEVADRALAGRINWSRLMSELSLVLPTDVWLEKVKADQQTGLELDGRAVDVLVDSPDAGHKSIAKMLVRLADLQQVTNVWLLDSTKVTDVKSGDTQITFKVSASVSAPGTQTANAPAPPAVPASNGQ